MPVTNRQILLAQRPKGFPEDSDFELVETSLGEPAEGEFLAQSLFLSVDPYMRGRMNDAASYAEPVGIGELMVGQVVSRVLKSNHPKFREGSIVAGMFGWQEYTISDGMGVRQIDPDLAPVSTALHVLGMPGLTAYFGLFEVGRPIAGDTVVVSAASGAVGAVVGQLAKINGCRVIGVAGSDDKVSYVVDELGFDAGINYKTEDVPERMAALCPDGVNLYWDNVGGPITDAAVDNLAIGGRAVICGQIALYNATSPPQGPRNIARMLLTRRARMQGFLVFQYADRYEEGLDRLASWIRDGSLKYREDIVEGIENSPSAFIGLLEGANFGKLVIKVS